MTTSIQRTSVSHGVLEMGGASKSLLEFLKLAGEAQRVATSVEIRRRDKVATLRFNLNSDWWVASDGSGYHAYGHKSMASNSKSPHQCWLGLVDQWKDGTLDPTSIKVTATKSSLSNKEFKKVSIAAWCESFGVAAPTDDELKDAVASKRAAKDEFKDTWIQTLRKGRSGVKEWNEQQDTIRNKLREWSGVELADSKLANLMAVGFIFKQAEFSRAVLSGSNLSASRFPQGTFIEAKLDRAHLGGTAFESADLQSADFSIAKMHGASLKKANCTGASFASTELNHADLCGTDLTGAKLDGAVLDNAAYDEQTKWPKGFAPTLTMNWKGPGASPAAHHLVKTQKPKKPLNAEAFLKRLEQLSDKGKLDKALKMLKADRFKLYAQVTDQFFVGIVKSQSDPELVYSCKLASDGVYGCCTQNLNICGGLRGSLCKHLLVLIVGLSTGSKLDPNSIDRWVFLSQGQKPVIDKDAMSEIFLRYKGAEACEVDWRPTETIPEDYYAF